MYEDQPSICESVEFKDSIDTENDSMHKILNGFKKLKTSSDIEILDSSSSTHDSLYNVKINSITVKKKVKKPVVVVRARKSKSSFPTQYDGSTLLINESEFESYLSDQAYSSKTNIKSKFQKNTNTQIKASNTSEIYTTDTFKVPLDVAKIVTTAPCLTLRLVKDDELIPLKYLPGDYWENFSSEYFSASDFFE